MSPRKRKQPDPDLGSLQQSDTSSRSNSKLPIATSSSSVEPQPKLVHGNARYNRIHYACLECARRKQKCNRKRPCQHCIERGIPESCRPHPSHDDNLDIPQDPDTEQRLRRIEHLLDDYLPRILVKVDKDSRTLSKPLSHPINSQELCQQAIPTYTATAQDSAQLEDPDPDHLEPQGRLSPETGLYNNGPTSHIKSILGDLPGSPQSIQPLNLPIRTVGSSSDFDESVMRYGRPAPPSHELLGALISRDHCQVLIDHYLTQIDWMRQPLPRTRLRQAFDSFWQSGPKITAHNINIFAIMCGICAVAALSVQHVLFPSRHQERSQLARHFHYAGRKALLMSTMLGCEDVDQIIAFVLSCHFLVLDRRVGESYIVGASVVPAALAIGLHRDGTKLGLPPQQVELRRRVWAAVYCMDRALAVHTGRPALLDDRFCDTRLVDDQIDFDSRSLCTAASRAQPLPFPPPSVYTLTLYRQQLARLEGEAAAFSQTLGSHIGIGDVLAFDHKIRRFQETLPRYFHARLTEDGVFYDTSLDATYPFLLTHRFLLHSDINALRIVLLRPFLLRSRRSISARFAPARKACIEAALHNAEMLRTSVRHLRASVPTPEQRLVWRAQIGTQSWFQSLLVCGLGMFMEPSARIASRLRSHLEYYIEEYHGKGFIAMDDMSEREAKVISMFMSRFEQMSEAGAPEEAHSNMHPSSSSDSEAWHASSCNGIARTEPGTARFIDGRQNRELRSAPGSLLESRDASATGNVELDKAGAYGDSAFNTKVRSRSLQMPSVTNEQCSPPLPVGAVQHGGEGHAPVPMGMPPYTDPNVTAKEFQVPPSSMRLASALRMAPSSSLDQLLSPFEASGSEATMASASSSGSQNPDVDPAYWQALIDKILS
ncbi:hypothetical protein EX895_001886 [Sporisorium graminicola]|uniref:Zn(2)-C6 fungal-type domain-containing protein n=1 Tax=Sporisorium graminicola TaxID=280036 RepID=A0A4U7KX46_9BASI|nr:hypothetical protein EX895_001886 [Sporisorium graminicola]TKY89355.1 hypothetical protein EX895_001886 [Sporisorium graminicola]